MVQLWYEGNPVIFNINTRANSKLSLLNLCCYMKVKIWHISQRTHFVLSNLHKYACSFASNLYTK